MPNGRPTLLLVTVTRDHHFCFKRCCLLHSSSVFCFDQFFYDAKEQSTKPIGIESSCYSCTFHLRSFIPIFSSRFRINNVGFKYCFHCLSLRIITSCIHLL